MDYWISLVSGIIGILSAITALYAAIQTRRTRREMAAERTRQNERIEVVLVLEHGNGQSLIPQRRELPVALQRRELTRAELLGRLGMLPMREAGRRFSLSYLSTPSFLERLGEAQSARGEEFAQFA